MSAKSSVFLVCLICGACSQTENFLTSPDVDTQSGFFPDSGFLRPGLVSSANSQDGLGGGQWHETPDNMNNDNKLLSSPETVAVKPKRLQQMMSRMQEEKVARLEHKQGSLPSQAEDSSYLMLFTGTKETKG